MKFNNELKNYRPTQDLEDDWVSKEGKYFFESVFVVCRSFPGFFELVCLPADDDNGGDDDTGVCQCEW